MRIHGHGGFAKSHIQNDVGGFAAHAGQGFECFAGAGHFAALLFNAFVWGLAWWPFQHMHQAGLHPLWATACMYAVVLLALLAWRPGILQQVRAHPQLWLLALASGLNNVAFNWAVTIGDVVRVILLFYLMPAATNGIQGFFRGIGDLRITLISSSLNMAGRVAAASVLVLLWKMEIEALPYSYVFGWVLMLAYELPAMLRYLRKNKM